jgi:hypothetical protein
MLKSLRARAVRRATARHVRFPGMEIANLFTVECELSMEHALDGES